MDKQMSRGRLIATIAVLFFSSICTMGDIVISPIVTNIYEQFADSPEWLIDLGITGPALVGIPFAFLSGWLCDRIDKKWLMVVGFAIFTVSACCGALITNIYYFVFMRCCATGVGWGLTNSCAYSIYADLFTDEGEHGKIVGWYETFMGVLSAILTAVSGVVAESSGMWQNSFSLYLVSIPILILLIVLLPSLPPKKNADEDGDAAEKSEKDENAGWGGRLVLFSIRGFLVFICFFVIMYMISLYVTDSGIGAEAFTGTLGSVSALSTAIASFLFGFAYKKFRDAVYLPSLFIMAGGFFVMGAIQTQAVTIACIAVMAFFWPFFYCYMYTHVTEIVPQNRQGLATGTIAVVDGLASAGCSYLLTISEDIMGVTSCIPVWPIMGWILLVVAIVSVIYYVSTRRRQKMEHVEE